MHNGHTKYKKKSEKKLIKIKIKCSRGIRINS